MNIKTPQEQVKDYFMAIAEVYVAKEKAEESFDTLVKMIKKYY